jgi:hypothetical protein
VDDFLNDFPVFGVILDAFDVGLKDLIDFLVFFDENQE